ncbi:MAG: type II secretion system protein GspK [Alphaproteobacteria bacterium]
MTGRIRKDRVNPQRGSALLVVLWSTLLLAGLATVVAGTVRTDLASARHLIEEAQSRSRAQAGVVHGALLLLAGVDPLIADGTVVAFDDVEVRVDFTDECGKVDLNTGWGELLGRLVDFHGGSAAAAILDWRDPDSSVAMGGAEDAQYRAAGRTHGARNGPLDSVAELQQIVGVDAGLMQALRPDVTVDCLNAGIDPMAASEAVLASIPGVGDDARATFLTARQSFIAGGLRGASPDLPGGDRYIAASPGLAVEITATAQSQDRAISWRAITWLTGDGGLPLLFRTWERNDR